MHESIKNFCETSCNGVLPLQKTVSPSAYLKGSFRIVGGGTSTVTLELWNGSQLIYTTTDTLRDGITCSSGAIGTDWLFFDLDLCTMKAASFVSLGCGP